jgi:hypothetical protein
VRRANLVLPPLDRQLVCAADCLFCFGGEVVKWWHIVVVLSYYVPGVGLVAGGVVAGASTVGMLAKV